MKYKVTLTLEVEGDDEYEAVFAFTDKLSENDFCKDDFEIEKIERIGK